MSDAPKDIDGHSGIETTGHSWDGIKELNNPLPRWWLYIWYATIFWAVIYMIFMPALPALPGMGTNTPGLRNHSDRDLVAAAVADLKAARVEQSATLLEASLEEIETDRNLQQFALAMGESLFGDNCATCHGAGGRGAVGYPSLADDVWIWDGTLDGIEFTLRHGIRHEGDDATRFSLMPAFGRDGLLNAAEVGALTQHVLMLSGQDADVEEAKIGAGLYSVHCATCHGDMGQGDRTQGAPNLTDAEWLYGSSQGEIYATIYNARNSHMPAWQDRLDDASIKALAVYVHTLGGGE
ncbi:MAG: cytochrome-c oxidase, cbb3-type subunit III [Pseudomonadota bacterium]